MLRTVCFCFLKNLKQTLFLIFKWAQNQPFCLFQCLPYSLLLQQLELKNVRELEDLLIEAVYCDIIHGKLDQRNQQVEVDFSVGRDLGPNELPNIANTLQEWYVCVYACDSVCVCLICAEKLHV